MVTSNLNAAILSAIETGIAIYGRTPCDEMTPADYEVFCNLKQARNLKLQLIQGGI
ncbi:hypothetical protein [Lactiplantibacillus plantarum]|uniref:hypothetical protein n=1 Tax=Lactiplantibacillus plantarum TaxID=1590 RepID=UPI002659D95D|nr:hypothetical protein [Lactiplantibacillus plantarum]